ncbi:hypothetical protein predicted by Glimmer/Critica [Helicobacter pylori B8]|uniref:Uncharacterized protein n=1 Tax=Helicobacter pylori (strain B8) TaxID=693745 RepID=D7FC88_HELP3|nr:hypothetical protein predicted by Glimmer/Critica [Helicobacter pylori B8]
MLVIKNTKKDFSSNPPKKLKIKKRVEKSVKNQQKEKDQTPQKKNLKKL